MFSKLSSLLDSFLEENVPGYDCIVFHKGKQVFRKYGGYSSIEEKTPMNGNEIYFIYSCSKPITAVAGLMCLEKGLFRLEDKINKYLPEFSEMNVMENGEIRPAANKITVKDLFCMTAGFGYDAHSKELQRCINELKGNASTRQVMPYLAKEPLLFEPGTRWEYSFCHDVLVALVEVVTGERFGDFVKKSIFDRIGMNSSSYTVPESLDNMAEQYLFNEKAGKLENIGKKLMDFADFGKDYESGGAGCISSAEDCIRFLEALRTGETLLKRSTINMMTTNMLNEEQMKSYWMPGYGYGLGVKCPIGVDNCCDVGWGGMAGALMSIDFENELSIYYVQHVLYAKNNLGRYLIPGMVREALGITGHSPEMDRSRNDYV